MIKVFGIVALLASSALGGGFSSNGECYRSATAPSRSLGSPRIFHHLTLGDCPLSIDHSDLPVSFIPVPISFVQMTVVMLNSRNWRREVEESGHAVFINICRQG